MSQTVYHVVPSNEQWAVKKQGGEQASRVAPTQQEAVKYAEEFARHQAPSRVVIHAPDGTIQSQNSFEPADRPQTSGFFTMPRVLAGVAVGLALGAGVAGAVWILRKRGV